MAHHRATKKGAASKSTTRDGVESFVQGKEKETMGGGGRQNQGKNLQAGRKRISRFLARNDEGREEKK